MSVPYLWDDCCNIKAAQCGKPKSVTETLMSTIQLAVHCRQKKTHELKASLDKQWTHFTKLMKKSQNATEASIRAAHFLIKNRKTFLYEKDFKETMMLIANTLFKDKKTWY